MEKQIKITDIDGAQHVIDLLRFSYSHPSMSGLEMTLEFDDGNHYTVTKKEYARIQPAIGKRLMP